MSDFVQIKVDGKQITAKKGENLLKVLLDNNFNIPHLCYSDLISPTGSCRLCLVKLNNQNKPITSCTVEVSDGLEVYTKDEEIENTRKAVLELILANHNDDCINCPRDGSCELQDLAFEYNLGRNERTIEPLWQTHIAPKDTSSPILDYDPTKCIQCERCIKACYEIQGKGVLSYVYRGIDTYVAAGFEDWETSECDGCGQCIQLCPTAAIAMKPVYGVRFKEKDIEKKVTTTCGYCGVGCQLDISVKNNQILKVDGANLEPNYTKTCVKGKFGLDFNSRKERLTKPLIKKDGKFFEVSWDEALDYTAKKLTEIKEKYGPDSIAGLSSARCTNEENYVFQKFIRAVIGTNNVDHCARLCHASTVTGLARTLGSGAMTNSIRELEYANVILVTGSNTTETHPVIATYIKRAVLFHNATLIVVDPRKIDLTKYAKYWLRQNNGTDVAWINGFMNVIYNNNLHDLDFIKARTEGFNELEKIIKDYTPKKVEEITGIPAKLLEEAAIAYGKADKASIVYAMGITQHSHGTNNVASLANLAMMTGNVGKESTGVNPLRGQNNVQGACDMGALPNVYPGYQKINIDEIHEKFENKWKTKLSKEVGLTVVEMMYAATEGKLHAFYFMGENPMVSDPNIPHVKEALEKIDFLAVQDIFPTETTQYADVIFPASSFLEKEGNFTNTERRIMWVNKVLDPPGEAKPDWWITSEIAKRMGYPMNYKSVKDIIDEINDVTPIYAGITYERIMKGERLQWPCTSSDHPGTKYLHKGKFAKGIGTFIPAEYAPPAELPDEEYPFVLSTGRVLFHYHTGTMTRKTKVLPQYIEGPYIEMNIEDMNEMEISDGEKVKVSSRRGSIETFVLQSEKVVKGNVFIPFHFAEAAANMLTNDVLDPIAKIPELKVCACKIEKIKNKKRG